MKKHRHINWESIKHPARNLIFRNLFYRGIDDEDNQKIFEIIKSLLFEFAKRNNRLKPIMLEEISKQTGMRGDSRNRYRELVRRRDGRHCQWCGIRRKKGRRLDVHHIDGTPEDTLKCDKNFDNMITLCHQCHLRIEGVKFKRTHRHNSGFEEIGKD